MNSLKDKTILITGAATGIGKASTEVLSNAGARIIALYHKSEKEMFSLIDTIEKQKGIIRAIKADLSKTSQIESVFEKSVVPVIQEISLNSKIDVLVNNAGICERTSLLNFNTDIFERTMSVNFLAPLFLIKNSLRHFNSPGKIINISSQMAQKPDSKFIAYAASKASLDVLSNSLVKDLGKMNITINTISPGLIANDIAQGVNNPMVMEFLKKNTALRRAGTALDIAGIVKCLAGSETNWLTGQIIFADGGFNK
jgi:NAD(P)-dependent dehydrogenase (short-subunit alcohol dehydrogenase family)